MPRVSVIIPTYNREHLIKRAIESVFNQTYRDLEVIVCDDGSKDKTVDVVRSMIDQAPLPLRLEVLPQNLGVSAARNWGIFCAQGELIGFLDSDDAWMPEKLTRQVTFLDADPAYVGVGCAILGVNESDGEVITVKSDPFITKDNELFKLINECYIFTPCLLIRKNALILSGMFDLRLKCSEDRDLWWRLPALGRLGYINEPLVCVFKQTKGLSNSYSKDTAKTYMPSLMRTLWYWRDKLTKEQTNQIMAKSFMLFAYDSSSAGKHKNALWYAINACYRGYRFRECSSFILEQTFEMIKSFLRFKK